MDFRVFTAGPNDAGRRFDKVLKGLLKNADVNIHEIIRKKLVKLNEKKAAGETPVMEGDEIKVAAFLFEKINNQHETEKNISAESLDTFKKNIIFENEHILAVNKPCGINVQPAEKNEEALSTIVKSYLSSLDDSLSFVPAPLHRIDKNTSGIVCFGKSLECTKWFIEMLKRHKLQKQYIALFENKILNKQVWEDYILENVKTKTGNKYPVVSVFKSEVPGSKKAVTIVNPVKNIFFDGRELTVCDVNILTGRKHQIRSQGAFHGFPLYGDTAYGGTINKKDRKFYLHAQSLSFPKNDFNIPENLTCNPPPDFLLLLDG